MSRLPLFLASVLTFSAQASEPVQVVYNVAATEKADVFSITADTSALESFTVQPARIARDDTQPEVTCINADNQTIVKLKQELSCDRISWQVSFAAPRKEGVNVGMRHNQYDQDSGWYLLTEWNSFVRLSAKHIPIDISICDPKGHCAGMPTKQQAPAYLVWGMPIEWVEINGSKVRISANHPDIVKDKNIWLPTFEKQLGYLESVFNISGEKSWDLNLFARERSAGNASGAAGFQSANINVPIEDGEIYSDSYSHMLKIMAHESVHGLDNRNVHVWVRESLAEYYAQKSLFGTKFSHPTPIERWDEVKSRIPESKVGLEEANQLLMEKGAFQYYALFYTKGPAFWNALDNKLVKQGDNLDNYIEQIEMNNKYGLSESFTAEIIKSIGDDNWNQLVDSYL